MGKMDAMRAMLDELMGKERDVPLDRRKNSGTRFDDPEVCKYALAGLCPYGLFKNTKSDLGLCKYEMHEEQLGWEELQAQWDQLSERDKERYGYERELLALLETLTRDMDRKIERQRDRADKESAPRPLTASDKARLETLLARQKEAADQSEKLAEAGEIDASFAAAQQAEEFKKQHESLLKSLSAPDRSMTVCDVCGVFINSTDNEQRRKDHLTGKQYLGWKAIRDKLAQLQERAKAKREERIVEVEREPDRGRERARSRDAARAVSREHDRRHHRERSRSREREERERTRRRSRSPRRRSRSRDRGYDYRRPAERPHDRYRERERGRY